MKKMIVIDFISYSQNREDLILASLLEGTKKGFYVDVGANHPEIDSVTKHFYELGWSGINIEPIPGLYSMLVEKRPRDININLGIGSKDASLTLREYPNLDGHSTFSEQTKRDKDVGVAYKDYEVRVTTLKSVFEKYNVKKIDFLKIDVEGFEDEVLQSNDWKKYRPTVVCIESDHDHKEWVNIFNKWGYELVVRDGLNDFYVSIENRAILKGFSERLVQIAHNSLKEHQAEAINSILNKNKALQAETKDQKNSIKKLTIQTQLLTADYLKLEETSYFGKTTKEKIKLAYYSIFKN